MEPSLRRSKRISLSGRETPNYKEATFMRSTRSPTPGKITRKVTPGRRKTERSKPSILDTVSDEETEEEDFPQVIPAGARGAAKTPEKEPASFNNNVYPSRFVIRDHFGEKVSVVSNWVKKKSPNFQNIKLATIKKSISSKGIRQWQIVLGIFLLIITTLFGISFFISSSINPVEKIRFGFLVFPEYIGTLFISNNQEQQQSFRSSHSSDVDLDILVNKLISSPSFQKLIRDKSQISQQELKKSILDHVELKTGQYLNTIRMEKEASDSDLRSELEKLRNAVSESTASQSQLDKVQSQLNELHNQLELVSTKRGNEDTENREMLSLLQSRLEQLSHNFDVTYSLNLKNNVVDETKTSWNKFLDEVMGNETHEFNIWLKSKFILKNSSDLENYFNNAKNEITNEISKALKEIEDKKSFNSNNIHTTTANQGENPVNIKSIIQEALNKYDADKTGMFDFALESAGGTIVSTRCTETYDISNAVYSVWGIPFWWEKNNPRTILQPGSAPGQCWAFRGSQGSVVIGLSGYVRIQALSLEHIPKMLAPDHDIASAPKSFSIFGLSKGIDDPDPIPLGNFTYSANGNPVQTFYLLKDSQPVNMVELKINSNQGHMTYTCIYRFRVHGSFNGLEPKH